MDIYLSELMMIERQIYVDSWIQIDTLDRELQKEMLDRLFEIGKNKYLGKYRQNIIDIQRMMRDTYDRQIDKIDGERVRYKQREGEREREDRE